MISTEYNFLYLHVPKTGGNSVQTALLPFSDDHKTQNPKQDGQNRFGIGGPTTPRKHATLAEYTAISPKITTTHRTIISVRHPFERAVSGYFSPHRWVGKQDNPDADHWNEADFIAQLSTSEFTSIVGFLRVGPDVTRPDITLRYETLQHDFDKAISMLGLPQTLVLPHLNRSANKNGLNTRILQSHVLRDSVEAFYKEDMDFFNYSSYVARN